MYLKHLHLENFRQFPVMDLNFAEKENVIAWPNKAGKTTVADAIVWALCGKLLSGSLDQMSLKPLQDTSLKVVAELLFATGWNGLDKEHPDTLTLRKEYKEDWVTTRGTTTQVLSGHSTSCQINGVKKSVQDYEKEIIKYFGLPSTEWFQILSDPFYFSQKMAWKDRRKIIIMIIGSILPEDVFERAPETKLIASELAKYYYETSDVKRALKTDKDAQQKDKDVLDAQILGAIVDKPVSEEEYITACKKISGNMNEEVALTAQKKGIKNPKIEALQKNLQSYNEEFNQATAVDNAELSKKNAGINESIRRQNDLIEGYRTSKRADVEKLADVQKSISKVETDNRTDSALVQSKSAELVNLGANFDKREAEKYEPLPSILCPNCQFDITASQNAKLKKAFNVKKAKDLDGMNTTGAQLTAEKDRLQKAIDERKAGLPKLTENELVLKKSIKDLEDKINAADSEISRLQGSKSYYAEKSERTKKAEDNIQATKDAILFAENESVDTAELDRQIKDLVDARNIAQETVTQYRVNEKTIKEKLDREKQAHVLAERIAVIEQKEAALLIYSKTYLQIMDERLKNAFPAVNIRLVYENIKSGSWDEDCTVMDDNGAPFETTNTASKFRLGLSMIEGIKGSLHLPDLPVLMDDAEHITPTNRHFQTQSQVVMMVAQEESTTVA